MRYTQSPTLSNEDSDSDLALRGADREHDSSDGRAGTAAEDTVYDARLRWPRSGASQRASTNRVDGRRPSLAKRMLRATARFCLAVLIGIGATLAWQSYGAQAQKLVVDRFPSLAWLVPPSSTPSNTASNTATASAPDVAQQPNPLATDIEAVRHEVEQLATNQEQLGSNEVQIARTVAAIQETEQEVSQKISSIAEPKPVHLPPRRPVQHLAPSSIVPQQQ